MIGKAGLERLEKARVTGVGIGAVGSFAVEALARSGVGELQLVDFDLVETSNINRQLIALESTLGRKKVEVARERGLDINPECRVETLERKVERAADTEPIF
jgi:tRNA A37 threonylcarbamoyladenosine dehydratase